ncbi:MAG TPA: hypothetical protein VFY29_07460, partial [Terriglobia bacterium]|nr:hypothetical protein [Terriglobia bacterium]
MSHGPAFSMPTLRKARIRAAFYFTPALVLLLILGARASQSPDADASNAAALLSANCATSGCHGGPGAYSFDATDPQTLIDAKVILPGNASGSEVISRLETGAMPMGGYQGKPGVKLPDADIQTLRRWIDSGAHLPAPAARPAGRPFISESNLLSAIARDLEGAPEADRRFFRYFSFVNLWNTSGTDDNALAAYRDGLGRLVNSLSWKRDIVAPRMVVSEGVLARVDIRDYGWTVPMWNDIVAVYPYGVVPNDLGADAERIRALSGAIPPYVRADWFTAKASVAPMYHEILQLPDMLDGLERRLGVNTMANVRSGGARRFGVQDSGVSRNNRAMERHATTFGAYWKSFDFNGNRIEQNIFRDPVHLTPDGGEIIFSLPNGLQAYFIVDSQGRRIDAAPVTIVRDRTNPDDPAVRNGRSCMGCHFKGMNTFRDDVEPSLQSRAGALFDMTAARTLYRGQPELDRLLGEDNARFAGAIRQVGGVPPAGATLEPINQLARRYEEALTVQQAAVELNLET